MSVKKPNKTKQNALKLLKDAIAATHSQYDAVHIVWSDAAMVAGAWTSSIDVLAEGKPARLIHTAGFLIQETAEHVLVSLSVDTAADMFDMVLKIPRENIRKLTKLRTVKV